MNDVGTRHGLYIVAWFDSTWWDRDDSRFTRGTRWPRIDDLRRQLDDAAADLRSTGAEIACAILDCSYQRPALPVEDHGDQRDRAGGHDLPIDAVGPRALRL